MGHIPIEIIEALQDVSTTTETPPTEKEILLNLKKALSECDNSKWNENIAELNKLYPDNFKITIAPENGEMRLKYGEDANEVRVDYNRRVLRNKDFSNFNFQDTNFTGQRFSQCKVPADPQSGLEFDHCNFYKTLFTHTSGNINQTSELTLEDCIVASDCIAIDEVKLFNRTSEGTKELEVIEFSSQNTDHQEMQDYGCKEGKDKKDGSPKEKKDKDDKDPKKKKKKKSEILKALIPEASDTPAIPIFLLEGGLDLSTKSVFLNDPFSFKSEANVPIAELGKGIMYIGLGAEKDNPKNTDLLNYSVKDIKFEAGYAFKNFRLGANIFTREISDNTSYKNWYNEITEIEVLETHPNIDKGGTVYTAARVTNLTGVGFSGNYQYNPYISFKAKVAYTPGEDDIYTDSIIYRRKNNEVIVGKTEIITKQNQAVSVVVGIEANQPIAYFKRDKGYGVFNAYAGLDYNFSSLISTTSRIIGEENIEPLNVTTPASGYLSLNIGIKVNLQDKRPSAGRPL